MRRRNDRLVRSREANPVTQSAMMAELLFQQAAKERIGDLNKGATGNQVFGDLRQMEDAIESELRPLWENPGRVRSLVGGGWIRSQVNAASN